MGNNDNQNNKKWLKIIIGIVAIIIGICILSNAWKSASNKASYNAGYREGLKSTYSK